MKRKISLVLVLVLLISLVWYLFIKPSDYLVSFNARTFPGAINQTIKHWNKSLRPYTPIQQDGILNLKQQLTYNDTLVEYNWEIIPINDSLSKIRVGIKDLDHSIRNKILVPFSNTVLERRSKENLINFNTLLQSHTKKFKVRVVGPDEIEPTYCAYLNVRCLQDEKAFKMMADFPFLSGFVDDNGLTKEEGVPFVEIVNWDMEKDSIEYNFCYPIIKKDSLPFNKEIKYKEFKGIKALKAIYNGNYITSDRAWYKLLDHAKNNDIEVISTPVEIFYNNPSTSGNELDWKAEIFMPLKETNE
ncbi:GyrI-like domain-containing protein [Flagellimonas eckloniae]|uniref:Transcriptional regulator n=1 Tax=Flagellimonas eckloniae TaxID=346185 RepID=A0A0N8WGB0_9FLAO|nr:GyrI-like domain-containing protein [Allomuricauda eckloniae]KQC30995.1 transcriptional regulator [Allomuricauda eckloniae]